jgi:hypothetical protein
LAEEARGPFSSKNNLSFKNFFPFLHKNPAAETLAFLWCLRYAKRRGAREREKRKERGKEKRKKRGKGEEMLFSLNPSLFSSTLHEKRNPLL